MRNIGEGSYAQRCRRIFGLVTEVAAFRCSLADLYAVFHDRR